MTLLRRALRALWADWGLRALVPMAAKVRLARARLGIRALRLSRARRRGLAAHSPVAHAPALRPERRLMAVTHVILASDLNPSYLDFWPLARRAWLEVAGLEPRLILVAHDEEVPASLREDDKVDVFRPVEGVHSAFQAQCVRLLYPALLEAPGAVLTSDLDLMPMNRAYWHEAVAALDADFFVAYRDVLHHRRMVAIAYNAAAPATWSEIFAIETLDDVRGRLGEWATGIEYDGVRGGSGWHTDQLILYDTLLEWGETSRRLWILDDLFTSFRRLDRADLADGLTRRQRQRIRAGRYSDFHALVPHADSRDLNEAVIDLALEAQRSRTRSSTRQARSTLHDARRIATLSAASDDTAFLTGNGLAARCRHVLNYDVLSVNEEIDNDWWFCKADFLDFFFEEVAPSDDFVLLSHNSDDVIDARFGRRLSERRLVAWFGSNVSLRNPKLFALPLGIANPHWPHGDVGAVRRAQDAPLRKTRLFDVSFDPATNPGERRYCLEQTGLGPEPRRLFDVYLRDLREAYFCISPSGNGIDTHRTWEALYLGTIPVVTRSVLTEQHADLPMVVLDDWAEFGSVDFSPDLYKQVWGDWDPASISLDRYLDRMRMIVAAAR